MYKQLQFILWNSNKDSYSVARGILGVRIGMAEWGADFVVKLGVNDALVGFGTALGRGFGESYGVYKEGCNGTFVNC